MNQTAPPPPPPEAPPQESSQEPGDGPRVTSSELRDIRRLRRVHEGRSLGGVCGGLGRHFDIDPTIFRVLLVVLVFFGGAGLFLYAALWLLVPDETSGRAVVHLGDDVSKVLIVVAVLVAAVIVVGGGWGPGFGWGPTLPIGVLVLLGVAFLLSRDRRQRDPRPTPPVAYGSYQPPAYQPPAYQIPAYQIPAYQPSYVPPPRPRRSGPVLFWPTLAILAIAVGCLGVYDASHDVSPTAYWALALAMIGAALTVGGFRGRPGGLILAGLVATAGLLASGLVGDFSRAQSLNYRPVQASDVQPSYRLSNGQLNLDLTEVADPQALGGRTIRVRGNIGEINVVTPAGVKVRVEARVRTAGEIDLAGHDTGGGVAPVATATLPSTTPLPPDGPVLTLDLGLRVGQIDVENPS